VWKEGQVVFGKVYCVRFPGSLWFSDEARIDAGGNLTVGVAHPFLFLFQMEDSLAYFCTEYAASQ
jgi:hypothetical protein